MPPPLTTHQLATIQAAVDSGLSYRQAANCAGCTKSGVYKAFVKARAARGDGARLVNKEEEIRHLPQAVLYQLLGSSIDRVRTEAAAALAGLSVEELEAHLNRSAAA